ncbi:MAG: DoxX family protein [Alphaproteobacteria bacterium]|nr:DoxX family protein [Alphaproteobacteria bacterium]
MMKSEAMPMASIGSLTRVLAALPRAESLGGSALQLVFRLWMAKLFWDSAMVKLQGWSTTVSLFRDLYQVPLLPPELAAWGAVTVDLVGPILLLVGFATRFAAIPMLGMTLTIQFLVPDFYRVEHYYWMMLLLSLIVRGPGLVSIDHWVRKRFHVAER